MQVNKQFWSLEISGGDTDIVLLSWVVELGKTPIDESHFAVGMIDHNVVRLHISVHDSLGMTEIKGLQDLEHVVSDVKVCETLVKFSEVSLTRVDELCDDGGCLGQWVSDNVDQVNNVGASLQSLQNLDLSSDLVLLHWFENFDDDSLIVLSVDALVDFRVLSTTNLLDDLVVVL